MKEVFNYVFPPMMIMWVFFIANNTMSDIFVEKRQKTLTRMLASTISVNQFLLSKMAHCIILCFIVEFILITIPWFTVGTSWGNPIYLLIVLFVTNLTVTGVLYLIVSLAKNEQRAGMISVIVIIFMSFLGGGMMPYSELPPFLQKIGSFTIVRWSVQGLEAVIESKPAVELLQPIVLLATTGIACTLTGMWILKRQMEAGDIS